MSKSRLVVDRAAAQQITSAPEIKRAIGDLAGDILTEAQRNLHTMGAVDSGKLLRSGFVDTDSEGKSRVGFAAEYAPVVHEGEGSSRGRGPRPFLSSAALHTRGDIT